MKLRSLLSRADVNTLRIEDAANRIAIGIMPGSSATALVSEIERLGVPLDAVIYEEVEPIHFDATLRDKVRYTVGGLEISNETDQVCTMGFNAYWGPSRVFITASHCTNGMGGVQGDEYFQPQDTGALEGPMTLGPWVPPGYEVGVERKDPAWTLGCDGDYLCRYSDSAIVEYYTGVGSDYGELARTTGIGSITISTTTPRWHITGEQALLASQVAHRVGRTSGYQTGEVEDSCDDVEIGGYKVLCSVRYGVGSSSGDSGAPVFRIVSSSNVKLAGIHFASNSTTSWFSPISQIRQELETPLYPLTTY
ncbi:MAG: hypothetical protein R6X22_04570 [Gemmatimonadota bacterium]